MSKSSALNEYGQPKEYDHPHWPDGEEKVKFNGHTWYAASPYSVFLTRYDEDGICIEGAFVPYLQLPGDFVERLMMKNAEMVGYFADSSAERESEDEPVNHWRDAFLNGIDPQPDRKVCAVDGKHYALPGSDYCRNHTPLRFKDGAR